MGDIPASTESETRTSTPSPSPSPEANDLVEHTLSRKREREVSLEPATPKTSLAVNASDIKSPAKKGRVHLDTTLEEEDERSRSRTPSHPDSPALSVSPPHEVKVRQISQGVEDINWQQRGPLPCNDIEHLTFNLESQGDKEEEQTIAQQEFGQNAEDPPYSIPLIQEAVADADEAADVPSSLPLTRRTSESEGTEPEKGLKRKLADRGTSQGPESPPVTTTSAEAVKRPRDDGDKDDNPRISKKQSPPPEQREKSPSDETTTPKFGGFMAYAATASPFASVKGQKVFSGASGSNQIKKPPISPTPAPTPLPIFSGNSTSPRSPFSRPTFATLSQQPSWQQTPPSTATKRTGFEAFAGPSSPFASPFTYTRPKSPSNNKSALARSKSPPRRVHLAGVFSTYASGGSQAFIVPRPKRARADSPSGGSSRSSLEGKQSSVIGQLGSNENSASGEEEEGEREESEPTAPSTFSEKLRSAKDFDDDRSDEEKEKLTEQEVLTGEEDEETIHQVRGKLYVLCPQNQWRERGTGQLRLNVGRYSGSGARLVMRKEAVFTVLLNVTLFPGMKCFLAQDPRYIRFSAIEGGATVHYNLRVGSAKIAQELLEEISANIPPC